MAVYFDSWLHYSLLCFLVRSQAKMCFVSSANYFTAARVRPLLQVKIEYSFRLVCFMNRLQVFICYVTWKVLVLFPRHVLKLVCFRVTLYVLLLFIRFSIRLQMLVSFASQVLICGFIDLRNIF